MNLAGYLKSWTDRGSKTGLRNFGVVMPDRLYRSARPDEKGYRALARLGVRTVINLIDGDQLAERGKATLAGIPHWYQLALDDHGAVDPVLVARFIGHVWDTTLAPIAVHCEGGRHRTGACVAAVRIHVQGWDTKAALAEADRFGLYGASGHEAWVRYIKEGCPLGLSKEERQ